MEFSLLFLFFLTTKTLIEFVNVPPASLGLGKSLNTRSRTAWAFRTFVESCENMTSLFFFLLKMSDFSTYGVCYSFSVFKNVIIFSHEISGTLKYNSASSMCVGFSG